MKILEESIINDGVIHKYLMVHQGTKTWRRTFFACIDHHYITPVIERWQVLQNKRRNLLSLRLLEVVVDDDTLVDMNYSEKPEIYKQATPYAKDEAAKLLLTISTESDLFSLILDKKYNWAYPNIVHEHLKILACAVIFNLTDDLNFEGAITKSESHFEKSLPGKELLLNYMHKKNITNVFDFK